MRQALEAECPAWILDTWLMTAPWIGEVGAEDPSILAQVTTHLKPDGTLDYFVTFNGRYREDPAELVHSLLEEIGHLLQIWRGEEFDFSLPYDQRPHEIEAKAFAARLAGYPSPHRAHESVGMQNGPPPPAPP